MKICVIGGGAAGSVAAIEAAKAGATVTIFEKNLKIGKKIYITGKGRCNLCNDCTIDEFMEAVITNPRFIFSSINALTPEDTISYFEELGLTLKVERGNRVFPMSDKSSDVIAVLSLELAKLKVDIEFNTTVLDVERVLTPDNTPSFNVKTSCGSRVFDKVIVATGGITYPLTGSTGDGYKFASRSGIEVVPPLGTLVAFECVGGFDEVSGLTLKNVSLNVKDAKGKTFFSEMGELLFTHKGVSGPIVLTCSSYVVRKKLAELSFTIDLKPSLTLDVLEQRLIKDFDKYKNKQFKNSLNDLFPSSFIAEMLKVAKIDKDTFCNSITAKARKEFAMLIKEFPLKVISLASVNEAVITSGGIAVKEINPKTMESKKVSGLYFCGECLDVDAKTGGYNLQIAFSTGFVAGVSAASKDKIL